MQPLLLRGSGRTMFGPMQDTEGKSCSRNSKNSNKHIKHACNVAKATLILRTLHATMLFCHQTQGHHAASWGIITVCTVDVRLLSCCLCCWCGSDVAFRHQPLHSCLDGGAPLCCLSCMSCPTSCRTRSPGSTASAFGVAASASADSR